MTTTTKIFIPHPSDECFLVGTLEQHSPSQAKQGRKLALVRARAICSSSKSFSTEVIRKILHGLLGHKDYLFQKRLGQQLPLDSFRFDFRGNHESGGKTTQGGFKNDIVDLDAVVLFMKKTYGYVVDLIVGHSRGSLVAMRWLCTSEDAKNVTAFVNIACRYRMPGVLGTIAGKRWIESIKRQGYHRMVVTVARKEVTLDIYPEDIENFCSWDTSFVWNRFPSYIDVLTIQGLADDGVQPYDSFIYAKAFSDRAQATHNLHIIEHADHNFTGRQDEVVASILEWLRVHERGQLKAGFWKIDVRGKL